MFWMKVKHMVLIMHSGYESVFALSCGHWSWLSCGMTLQVVTMETGTVLFKGGLCCLVCKVCTSFFISYLYGALLGGNFLWWSVFVFIASFIWSPQGALNEINFLLETHLHFCYSGDTFAVLFNKKIIFFLPYKCSVAVSFDLPIDQRPLWQGVITHFPSWMLLLLPCACCIGHVTAEWATSLPSDLPEKLLCQKEGKIIFRW